MNEAKWWITLSDNGYQLARFVAEPPNAVRGPFSTYDEVVAETQRMEYRATASARVAALGSLVGIVIAVSVVSLIVWAVWEAQS